jgi:hypothetical protein
MTRHQRHRARWLLAPLLAAALVPAAATPSRAAPVFTIANNNATFNLSNVPSAPTDPPANIEWRVGGNGNPNQAYQSWWWFRLPNDTRESAVNGMNVKWTVNGNTATADFTLTPTLTATMEWTMLGYGVGGQLDTRLTVKNTGQQDVDIALFHFIDLELGGTPNDDSAAFSKINGGVVPLIRVTDPNWVARYTGDAPGFFAYDSDAFPKVRDLLTNNAKDDFPNAQANFGPGDWQGGFEWKRTVAAGGSTSIRATVVLQPKANPEPATYLLLLSGLPVAALVMRRRRIRQAAVG